jgi:hypothetical protein
MNLECDPKQLPRHHLAYGNSGAHKLLQIPGKRAVVVLPLLPVMPGCGPGIPSVHTTQGLYPIYQ